MNFLTFPIQYFLKALQSLPQNVVFGCGDKIGSFGDKVWRDNDKYMGFSDKSSGTIENCTHIIARLILPGIFQTQNATLNI